MGETLTFKSRTAKLKCSVEEYYYFVTDIRNFRQFISSDSFSNIKISEDTCSFSVTMLGEVNISTEEKIMFSKVAFKGNSAQIKNFSIIMEISESPDKSANVNISLIAEMNPILKMIASDPVNRFLEKLVDEMEKFEAWNTTKQN